MTFDNFPLYLLDIESKVEKISDSSMNNDEFASTTSS